MYPVIDTRRLKVYCPIEQKTVLKLKNICLGKNGREITTHADGYYYVNKNNTISKRRYRD